MTRRVQPGRGIPRALATGALFVSVLAGCGGSGSNPLGNPQSVTNSPAGAGQRLSFAYFQYCINPIFDAALSITQSGVTINNTCSNASCHNSSTGHGGALRIAPGAAAVALASPVATIQASDIYRNYLSAQGETIIGAPAQSLLVNKPLVRNVLHGGGLIFSSDQDAHVRLLEYWISNPMPAGQNEFSTAGYNLFTPALDPNNPGLSGCNSN